MKAGPPLVTLGVPVRNGAAMLAAALDSIVAQDYPNLEVVVSDNASTDATPEILRDYVQRYRHIRVIRQERRLLRSITSCSSCARPRASSSPVRA